MRPIARGLTTFADLHLVLVADNPPPPEAEAHLKASGVAAVHHVGGPFLVDGRYGSAIRMPHGQERLALLTQLPAASHMMVGNDDLARRIFERIAPLRPDAIHYNLVNLMLCQTELQRLLSERLGGRVFSVLDLNDDESVSWDRIAAVQERYGATWQALEGRLKSSKIRGIFQSSLRDFDVVTVCSQPDAARLANAYPGVGSDVIANVSPVEPRPPRVPRHGQGVIRLLYVGHLSYVPNIDAIEILTRVIVPELREQTGREVSLTVAGRSGEADSLARWRGRGADVHDSPPDLDPFYAEADLVVIPIRAAGGTRIKILEAFSYGVPVVSTSIGIEGLEAVDGEHAVIRDSLAGLVDGCRLVLDDPALAARLVAGGRQLVSRRFGATRVEEDLRRIYSPVLERFRAKLQTA